jgi:hypothetical protein
MDKLKGKKIVNIYHDSAYGNGPAHAGPTLDGPSSDGSLT